MPPATPAAAAAWLLESGLWPVVIRPGEKALAGQGWGLCRPTPDSLRAAYRRWPGAGVGLLLGPPGGVVDLEEDDPAAAAPELARLFPGGPPETVGWVSPRGRHRLFAWDSRFARGPAVVVLAGGALELRAGGPGKRASARPPPVLTPHPASGWGWGPSPRCRRGSWSR